MYADPIDQLLAESRRRQLPYRQAEAARQRNTDAALELITWLGTPNRTATETSPTIAYAHAWRKAG